jgi:hypothetical protein
MRSVCMVTRFDQPSRRMTRAKARCTVPRQTGPFQRPGNNQSPGR